MPVSILTNASALAEYDLRVRLSPQGTLWQSLTRKKYVEACGKQTRIYVTSGQPDSGLAGKPQTSALVIIDRTAGGFSTWEIPRGPLWSGQRAAGSGQPTDILLERIIEDAKRERCLVLYFSPQIPLSADRFPLIASPRHIHCEATRMIDLTLPEEQLLAQMHPKGRYNISVARKHGVTVREGSADDIESFYKLLKTTGERDGFVVSQKSHYRRFLTDLEGSFILMAEYAKKPIAGLIGVRWGTTGFYYYGASSYDSRQLMAPYLLQWEAMKLCKAAGCTKYDLLGIATDPTDKNDPWAGITDFKRKFGGSVVSYPPEQMMVLRPLAYKALELKRRLFG